MKDKMRQKIRYKIILLEQYMWYLKHHSPQYPVVNLLYCQNVVTTQLCPLIQQ